MVARQPNTIRNTLISAVDKVDCANLMLSLDRVTVAEGTLLARADESIDAIFFPESLIASFVDVLSNGERVEIGIVGYEGMIGWPVLLGCTTSPHDAVVQAGGGTALTISTGRLLDICAASPSATALFLRYVNVFVVQVGRTAVSNLRDPVERRLSRWLLMCHDRREGDEIDLTHKVIAGMLGIRRASVTDGLHNLEGESAIRNRRGQIVIRDRDKLQRLAGDGYGHAEAHYSRTIAPFGK